MIEHQLRRHQDSLRAIQIGGWAQDKAGFAAACERQALLVAVAEADDRALDAFIEAALGDLGDEMPE